MEPNKVPAIIAEFLLRERRYDYTTGVRHNGHEQTPLQWLEAALQDLVNWEAGQLDARRAEARRAQPSPKEESK